MDGERMRRWALAGALAVAGGVVAPRAPAATFTDGFDSGTINPAWWTTAAEGGSTIVAANGRIEMTQGAGGGAALVFRLPVTGDFAVTIDYTLLNWPASNMERLALNAYAGPANQLLIERVSDRQYDPLSIGEVYLTDFPGQGILGTPTTDLSGTLRLERTGDVVRGSYRSGTDWAVIGTYVVAGEGDVARTIGMGLWAADPVTPGVMVALDNFALNAATAPVPVPAALPLLLSGLALVAVRLRAAPQRRIDPMHRG